MDEERKFVVFLVQERKDIMQCQLFKTRTDGHLPPQKNATKIIKTRYALQFNPQRGDGVALARSPPDPHLASSVSPVGAAS